MIPPGTDQRGQLSRKKKNFSTEKLPNALDPARHFRLLRPPSTLSPYPQFKQPIPAVTFSVAEADIVFRLAPAGRPRRLYASLPLFRKSKRGNRMSRLTDRTTPHSVSGSHSYSPKEEATLRKAFEYVAWTGLLTALLCPVSLGEAGEPVRARVSDEASATAAAGSARQFYTAGRELYLQERYAEAVSAFEAATSGESDLNDAEQERLQNYLRRARVKAGS